ncbi:MAG: HYR domain-containing protein [Bacteroidetes bacterium]|nr:HYR domain-containing protein [Bacteroidota bacterium]
MVDNQAPTITCPANISVNATAGTCGRWLPTQHQWARITVGSDNNQNCGPASGSTFPVGVTTVTHQVTAKLGQTASLFPFHSNGGRAIRHRPSPALRTSV